MSNYTFLGRVFTHSGHKSEIALCTAPVRFRDFAINQRLPPTTVPPRQYTVLIFELFYGSNDRVGFPALTHHIRFLADQYEFGRDDVSSLGPATIQKPTVLEFALRA